MWSPVDDTRAFIALRAAGRLSLLGWLGGLAHRQVLPMFDWSDPLPSLVSASKLLSRVMIRRSRRRQRFESDAAPVSARSQR
jgi:hypothetical protein